MTIYQSTKDLYFCEVIETGEKVYFYITTNIKIDNSHSINIKLAPYTSTGFTQNLGRDIISIGMDIILVDSIDSTMEEKYDKLMQIKNTNKVIKVVIGILPLGSSNFHIKNCNLTLKEPSRLTINLSLVEDLQSAIKTKTQPLVGNQALNNITNRLRSMGYGSFGQRTQITWDSFKQAFNNNPSNQEILKFLEIGGIVPKSVWDKFPQNIKDSYPNSFK